MASHHAGVGGAPSRAGGCAKIFHRSGCLAILMRVRRKAGGHVWIPDKEGFGSRLWAQQYM